MQREFDVVIERDSAGYYVGTVPALRGCHTQARSLDELMERMQEAVELCLEVEGEEIEPMTLLAFSGSLLQREPPAPPDRCRGRAGLGKGSI